MFVPGMEIKLTEKKFRKLLIIPLILILLSLSFLAIGYIRDGTPIKRGIDLEGGVQFTIRYSTPVNTNDFESSLRSALGTRDIDVTATTNPTTRQQETLIISVGGDLDNDQVLSAIENYLNIELGQKDYSVRALGSSLASTFWTQALWVFAFAFIFMASVVFFFFRKLATSGTIVLAISADIIIILGFMSILNLRLSLATIAALLMIIGYGVDSNILLANKLVKEHRGDLFNGIRSALHTGLTMSATTLSALTALMIFANSIVLREIAGVLLIGLLADLVNTWILNANLLLWRLK
jgi:preprotein translocase subunit SecF